MVELHTNTNSFKLFLNDVLTEVSHIKIHPSGYVEIYSKNKIKHENKYIVNLLTEDMWGTSTIIKDEVLFTICTETNNNYNAILLGLNNDRTN